MCQDGRNDKLKLLWNDNWQAFHAISHFESSQETTNKELRDVWDQANEEMWIK